MQTVKNKDVIAALSKCTDPEIGLDIVNLGLVYGVHIDESNNANIKVTMTSPMCPVTSVILADMQLRVEHIQGVGKVNVDLVWEPMWNPDMINPEARASL